MLSKMVQAVCFGLLVATLHSGLAHASPPTSLIAALSCAGNGVELTIAWSNGDSPVLQQYVLVSRENNWTPGSFTLNGPIAAGKNSMALPAQSLGAPPYYVRVSQLMGNGIWESSETLTVTAGSLTANTCVSSAPAAPVATPPPAAPAATATPPPIATPVVSAEPAPPPDELTAWLQSIGVLDQPTVQSFVRNAVAAFQQPAATPVPGQP